MPRNMYSSPVATARPSHLTTSINLRRSLPISVLVRPHPTHLNVTRNIGKRSSCFRRRHAILQKWDSKTSAQSDGGTNSTADDFVSRVLRENPSQVERKYLVGDKLYTWKEKEDLRKSSDAGVLDILKKLNLKAWTKKMKTSDEVGDDSGVKSEAVYLKDILREYRGKLYVPEQVFGAHLSEEEEFDRELEALPKMSFEEFQKALKRDKIKLLRMKEELGVSYGFGLKDFIVELKEIPGDKRLQRTKW